MGVARRHFHALSSKSDVAVLCRNDRSNQSYTVSPVFTASRENQCPVGPSFFEGVGVAGGTDPCQGGMASDLPVRQTGTLKSSLEILSSSFFLSQTSA